VKGRTRLETKTKVQVVDRTGVAVYRDGHFRVLLHPFSSRTFQFQYGPHASQAIVRILVLATSHLPSRGPR